MTTMNEERSGYMPIPTAEQVAEALANVRCFHDMSAELIAPELLKNLLAAAPAEQGEVQGRWIPVSERLPSVAQEVIVNSEFDGVTAGFLDSYGEWYSPNSDYKLTRVVAWQPLPAAP